MNKNKSAISKTKLAVGSWQLAARTKQTSVPTAYCLLLTIFLFMSNYAQSQELNCGVSVNSSMVNGSDKTIFQTLQTAIREFLNNRHWTNDKFLNQERIDCNMLINITSRPSTDQFVATLQIQSSRPVYKASYPCPMINHMDQDFTFTYVQDQYLDYTEAGNKSNLTSVIAYYAYIIIGMDYDSFSPNGGSPYFAKAQSIVTDAQNLPDLGWKAFENTRNRYWLTDNLFNTQFKPVRDLLYIYHRQGFDMMSENAPEARAKITEALKALRKVNSDQPNSLLMKFFFNAKADEIVNLYSGAYADEKSQVVTVLDEVDPANLAKYSAIQTAGGK